MLSNGQEEYDIKAEIIAVGTELLLGQIVNSNAQYLSQQCAYLGIDVYFQTVVGDNKERLKQAFILASERADIVICTGGLGPTQDDITKQVLAQYVNKGLKMHEPSLHKIEQFFKQRGTVMSDNNARQALLIEDSDPLINENGMAVGIALKVADTSYLLLPGPPRELQIMFENHAKHWLIDQMGDQLPLYSSMLKFVGIGESSVEEQLIDLIETQHDPTIAPYADLGELTLRLSTKASDADQAEKKLTTTKEMIYERLGDYIYAEKDVTIEQVVIDLLRSHNATLAVAESCTGGLLSHLLTSIPGSSSVFKGGIVCYSNDLKANLLHVPMTMLEGEEAPGAISSETAQMLAEQLLVSTAADYGIAITGVAGPEPIDNKHIGLVYIALKYKNDAVHVDAFNFTGNRSIIKTRAAKTALYWLWQHLRNGTIRSTAP